MPWEINVNTEAQRFIREDEPSVDVREHVLLDQQDLRYWVIFDQAIFDQAPPMVLKKTREQMAAATWATLGAWNAGANPATYRAVFADDMSLDITGIKSPGLLLTDTGDSLHEKGLRVSSLRRHFTLQTFSAGGSFSPILDPARWVQRVQAFISETEA